MQKPLALLLSLFLFLSTPLLALKPSATYVAIPDTLSLPYEKNTIVTTDNVKLRSWTFLPDKEDDNHTTLVLAYADAGNMSWWLGQATILSQSGFTVVLFDYRGFGESDAFTMNPKMLYYNEFAKDLSAAILFARNKYPANKTGVWAFSMGTIVTTLAAQTARLDFIIGDGFVTDPQKIKAFYAKKKDEILLPKEAPAYASQLKEMKMPILLISGKKDQVTPDADVRQLKRTRPGTTVFTHTGGHMEGFTVLSKEFPGSEYVAEMKKFLRIK